MRAGSVPEGQSKAKVLSWGKVWSVQTIGCLPKELASSQPGKMMGWLTKSRVKDSTDGQKDNAARNIARLAR